MVYSIVWYGNVLYYRVPVLSIHADVEIMPCTIYASANPTSVVEEDFGSNQDTRILHQDYSLLIPAETQS
jgi:hypothetical protein